MGRAGKLLNEEIFGPILPVVTVPSIESALAHVSARPNSLALYVFAADEGVVNRVIDATSSGGACPSKSVKLRGSLGDPQQPF